MGETRAGLVRRVGVPSMVSTLITPIHTRPHSSTNVKDPKGVLHNVVSLVLVLTQTLQPNRNRSLLYGTIYEAECIILTYIVFCIALLTEKT